MTDKQMQNLEDFIPQLAQGAINKAYLDALASGNSVLEVIDGAIYEIFSNGEKNKIKDIEPLIQLDMTKKITLK